MHIYKNTHGVSYQKEIRYFCNSIKESNMFIAAAIRIRFSLFEQWSRGQPGTYNIDCLENPFFIGSYIRNKGNYESLILMSNLIKKRSLSRVLFMKMLTSILVHFTQ